MQIRYGSPQTSQQQIHQPTLRQVLTHPDSNLLLQQQQHQHQQQQQHVQQIVVSSAQTMQQQRNVILLPSGQSATIIRGSLPVNSPGTTSGSTILISSTTGAGTTQISQQTSNMANVVPVNVSSIQLASSSTGGIIDAQQIYQPTVQNSNTQQTASDQQYLSTMPTSTTIGVTRGVSLSRNNSSVSTTSNSLSSGIVSNNYNRTITPAKTSVSAPPRTASVACALGIENSGIANNLVNNAKELIDTEAGNKANTSALTEAAKQTTLIERVDLDALLKNVDEYSSLEDEAAAAILQLNEDFVDDIVNGVVMLSNYRGSKKIDTNDVRFFLKSRFNVALLPDPKDAGAKITGGGVSATNLSTDATAPKRRALAIHDQRLALIDRTLKKF